MTAVSTSSASSIAEERLPALLPEEGTVIAGKYKLDRALGSGGMGTVIAARHVELGVAVAIKFLRPDFAQRKDHVTRFLREARAAFAIANEHVARVLDVGTLPNGVPYLVMERLVGNDLSELLDQEGRVPAARAVDLVLQACEALAEAHALGIVHRDIKPSNLFLTRRESGGTAVLKVLDFGIAKTDSSNGSFDVSLTSTGNAMGSPRYMSPEQLRSAKDVDLRSDIWSLGVVLYELLSGTPAFDGDSVPALSAQIAADEAPPLRDVCPGLPRGLEAVVARCMAKARTERFASVAELAVALAPFTPITTNVERITSVVAGSSRATAPAKAAARARDIRDISTLAEPAPVAAARARWPWMLAGGATLGFIAYLAWSTSPVKIAGVHATVQTLSTPVPATASASVVGTSAPVVSMMMGVTAEPSVSQMSPRSGAVVSAGGQLAKPSSPASSPSVPSALPATPATASENPYGARK